MRGNSKEVLLCLASSGSDDIRWTFERPEHAERGWVRPGGAELTHKYGQQGASQHAEKLRYDADPSDSTRSDLISIPVCLDYPSALSERRLLMFGICPSDARFPVWPLVRLDTCPLDLGLEQGLQLGRQNIRGQPGSSD